MCGGRGRIACRKVVKVREEVGENPYGSAEVVDIAPNTEYKLDVVGRFF